MDRLLSLFGVALCLAVAFVVVSAKTEFVSDNVVKLTKNDFTEKTSDGKLWFIKFYAPWCGHCKKLAPTWNLVGSHFKENNNVMIAHVDCTVNKEICEKAEVKGYPTLKTYFNGQAHKKFAGERSEDKLKKFVDDAFTELFSETTT